MRHLRQGFFSVFPNFYKNSFLMITIPIEFARLIWRMLLANSSVSKAAKTARVCRIRHAPLAASLYSLFIQNHYAKSGKVGFFETNSGSVNESLIRGSFFVRNWEGIEALAKPTFVRGVSPFNGWRTLRPLHPKWIRSFGCAARNPRCSHPCGVKCCRILSFPKALFYNLAALRIK